MKLYLLGNSTVELRWMLNCWLFSRKGIVFRRGSACWKMMNMLENVLRVIWFFLSGPSGVASPLRCYIPMKMLHWYWSRWAPKWCNPENRPGSLRGVPPKSLCCLNLFDIQIHLANCDNFRNINQGSQLRRPMVQPSTSPLRSGFFEATKGWCHLDVRWFDAKLMVDSTSFYSWNGDD